MIYPWEVKFRINVHTTSLKYVSTVSVVDVGIEGVY